MAYAYGETVNPSNVRWTRYWIRQYADNNIKIHVDSTGGRYARTSQEAYDNMLTLYTILSDENVATYWADTNAVCKDLIAGSPAAIRDFIIKSNIKIRQQSQGLITGCGSDTHGTITICGQGGVDINKYKAKTCLMTNIAGLMGVIEVVSGYNPFFHTQEYIDLQGYYTYFGDNYYNWDPTDTNNYSITDRYNTSNYSLSGKIWTPYTYKNTRTNSQGMGNIAMGTNDQMQNCRYGILGLLTPYSCSCYSYGRKYNPNNDPSIIRITEGDPINYIEQIIYDICGLAAYNTAYITASPINFRNWVPFGLSNGGNSMAYTETDYIHYNGQSKTVHNENNFLWLNGDDYNRVSHWNGLYTKRDFSSIVCDNNELTIGQNNVTYNRDQYINGNGSYVASIGSFPPWSSKVINLADYQYLPFWATGTRNKPETAAVQIINSIDTWNINYWTPEKIQQAKEAARYWYDLFGGPGDAEDVAFQGKTNYNYTIMNI